MWFKHWLVALLGMTFIWGLAPTARAPVASATPSIAIPHVIRFRVIANSDNPVDQAIKLDVRDRILKALEPELNGVRSRRVASARIRALRPELNFIANQVLAAHHVDYRARVEWTHTVFPTKAYGSWVLPAGRYQALLIVLGKGAGHNWWCVLFPSLCFIDMGNALAVPSSVAASTPAAPPAPTVSIPVSPQSARTHHPRQTHRPSQGVRSGHIAVLWTTPRFFTTFLAILRR